MPATIHIRQATSDDAPEIALLKSLTWPDESVDVAQIARAIREPGHATFVAAGDGGLVGFVDGFSTLSSAGVQRWEVDLLAVHPHYRGQRLGARLVRANTAAGRQRGAAVVRSLIHVENIASQQTFARCAYQLDDTVCNLYVLPGVEQGVQLPPDAHLVPVNTFNYRGLWLETGGSPIGTSHRDIGTMLGRCGAGALLNGDWDLLGSVIPVEQAENERLAQAAGFVLVGQYQWWFLEGSHGHN
jgi:GNAT superfamily N-acetyltransferase